MITMITFQLPKEHSKLYWRIIGDSLVLSTLTRLMAFISWKRLLLAAGVSCTSVQKTVDHILPLESVKELVDT